MQGRTPGGIHPDHQTPADHQPNAMKKTAKKNEKNSTPDQTAGTLPDFDGITPPAAGDLPFMDAGDWDTPDDWDADLQPWDTDLQPWDDADDTPPETYPQTPTETPTETPTNSNGDDEPGTDKDFDRYAADVQNGYGYYDAAGTFHYYENYWD